VKGMILCGIDVSARTLDVAIDVGRGPVWTGVFDNTESGHRKLAQKLGARRRRVRVVVEATGVYHLDLALALLRSNSIEVIDARCFDDDANAATSSCELLGQLAVSGFRVVERTGPNRPTSHVDRHVQRPGADIDAAENHPLHESLLRLVESPRVP
jgi:hypothetical protein